MHARSFLMVEEFCEQDQDKKAGNTILAEDCMSGWKADA